MDIHWPMKYLRYSVLAGVLVVFGCSQGKQSEQLALESVTTQTEVADLENNENEESPEILEIIKIAESYYDEGCDHYKHHRWALARQAFDLALETLLDADIDAETHYKLSRTYDRLFYKIHKLELEQEYVEAMAEIIAEEAESTDQLEAFLSSTRPELLENESKSSSPFQNSEGTLGEIVIDESDATIMKYVKDFSRERSQYRKGIERSAEYLPMMLRVFQEYQIPTELTYLPLIESNFRVEAVSPTGAVGLWQFIRTTGRNYGLQIDSWVDERRDPEKSTEAAAKYLRDLYDMLGDWDLALSGYYMGEYKVHKAIGTYRTRDISTLAETRAFGNGAKHYVSRFKAAVILAKSPEKYGVPSSEFSFPHYETVQVKKGQSLKTLAKEFGISYKELRKLNPELKQSKTPPGKGQYLLKVPQGVGGVVIAKASEPENSPETTAQQDSASASSKKASSQKKRASSSEEYWIYKVRRGDNLSKIATRYRVSTKTLQRVNNIRNARSLQIGQRLKIPTSDASNALAKGPEVITHTLQRGETLGSLARRYKVDVSEIKAYNNIKNDRRLQIGQRIKVPLSHSSVLAKTQDKPKKFTYRVKRGDSLSKIASTFGVSVTQLRKWNNFEPGALIYPGNRINVWY